MRTFSIFVRCAVYLFSFTPFLTNALGLHSMHCVKNTTGWNNLSGELPHELSYFSESLVDLNLFGGSISGPVPDSYGNLTKLAGLSLAEHCLTGTIPEGLTQLSDLAFLTVHGNPELRGSLNGLCDGDQFRGEGSLSYVSADCGDCPGSEPLLECDCCTCCDSNTFDC